MIAAALALVLSFGLFTFVPPTLDTVSAAPSSNASPVNNTSSVVNNKSTDKQAVGSQENNNIMNDGPTTSPKQSSQVDPATLPFPMPTDHSKKIKTSDDSSDHEQDKSNSHQRHNNNNNNNNNNGNKDSKANGASPLRLPFP
jgi:hypothetical protein